MWLELPPFGRSSCVSSPVSRILSRGPKPTWVAIYLRPSVAGRLVRPTRRHQASNLQTSPYSALHRVGLARPPCHHDAGALLPHLFTVAAGQTGVLCIFCGAFPGVSPAGRYPAPCSTVSGLSSKTRRSDSPRLPGLPSEYTASSQTLRRTAWSRPCVLVWGKPSRSGRRPCARFALLSILAPALRRWGIVR